MNQNRHTIEDLCAISGLSRRTIRFYVQEGLIPPPAGRGRGGFYSDSHIERLRFVTGFRERGVSIPAIRAILDSMAESEADPPEGSEQCPPEGSGPFPRAGLRAVPGGEPEGSEPAGGDPHRQLWVRTAVAPGVELHVGMSASRAYGDKVSQIIMIARKILGED